MRVGKVSFWIKSIFKTTYIMPFAKVNFIGVGYFTRKEQSEENKREGGREERIFLSLISEGSHP